MRNMQIKRLRTTVAFILANAKRLNMNIALLTKAREFQRERLSGRMDNQPIPKCNTVGCLAGWGVQLFDYRFMAQVPCDFSTMKTWEPIQRRAIQIFGLTPEQAKTLFHMAYWQDSNRLAYFSAKTPKAKAKALAAQVEYVIANRATL